MSQPSYQPLDQDIIETLKAARNQIFTVASSPFKVKDKQESTPAPLVGAAQKSSKESVEILATGQTQFAARSNFAEEFVQKLSSLEREKTAVDEEITKVEKLWSNLTEKKKQLEDKRSGLIKVKDKLKELDKEMSDMLKSQSV